MRLTSRSATEEDFEDFFQCVYTTFGFDESHRSDVKREWAIFRQNPYAISVVVEDLDRSPKQCVIGYAEGTFVTDRFVARAKSGVRPWVNRQVAEAAYRGQSPILTLPQICEANSGEGLTLLLSYYAWRGQNLTQPEIQIVREYISRALNRQGWGYKYKEVMIEVAGEEACRRAISAGFLLRTDYADYYKQTPVPPPHLHPYLLSITRSDSQANDGSLLAIAFAYTPPRFQFTLREQDLLCLALEDKSDEEIAEDLDRTPVTVKKRWEEIYAHVADAYPELLPVRQEKGRGPEKRRILIAYLRDHLEELRPNKARRKGRA